VSDLLAGLAYPLRAMGLINRQRRLWKFIVAPIMVNLVVGALLYLGLYAGLLRLLEAYLVVGDGTLAAFFLWLVRALLAVTLAVAIGFLLVRFGVLLGSPWYGQLSEELEALLTGRTRPPQKLTARGVSYDLWRALQFEGKKLLLALGIWLPSLLLLLVPGLGGLLYAVIGITLGATISCLDFFDGPLERRRLGFRAKLGLVRRLLPASASFGLIAFGLVSIPLVNLLAIPLCVTAGNMLVIERGIARAGSLERERRERARS
jgi:CysZ protein